MPGTRETPIILPHDILPTHIRLAQKHHAAVAGEGEEGEVSALHHRTEETSDSCGIISEEFQSVRWGLEGELPGECTSRDAFYQEKSPLHLCKQLINGVGMGSPYLSIYQGAFMQRHIRFGLYQIPGCCQ